MSDLCMYELEDNVWDEFSESDDHIVPHPGHEYGDRFVAQGIKHKKPESEIINVANNEDDALTYRTQEEEETSLPTLVKKDTILEKDSWSNTPDDVFPASRDSGAVKEFTTIRSEETSMSSHCLKNGNIDSVGSEFCANDPTSDEKCSAVVNNLYSYPLGHNSQTGNDLSFFDNDREDKESSDPLYYGWPDDIGNFDDVDRMFRSCDSTFGLGSLSNEDDLCWFSSSRSTERSDDALNLGDSKFLNSEASALDSVSEHPEASQLSSDGPSVYDSNKKSIFTDDKISSGTSSAVDHSSLGYLTFLNGSDTKSASEDDFVLKEKMNWNKKQARHNKQLERRRKERNIENGSSHLDVNVKHFADRKHSSEDSYRQVLPLPGIQQHKQEPSSSRNFKPANKESPAAFCGPVSVKKAAHQSEYDIEGVGTGIPAELDSSNVQESSCMSSVLDGISLEATSFCQLKQVMEQLDVRTKLCIRDSLYRLARSAEQRHNYGNASGGKIDGGDRSGALMVEEADKTGFMDMETDTNPIDRSIAHLLFHRPSDPSLMPTDDASSLKSHTRIHGSISSLPVMTKERVCQEETATGADGSLLVSNDKQ